MRGLFRSWSFLAVFGVLTVLSLVSVLVLRPFGLPGWLSWAAGANGVHRSPGAPLLPDFSVAAGDRRLRVVLPPGTDAGQYRVDAVSETNAGEPGSCLVAETGSPSGPGCSIEGLRDGINYLVSLRQVGAPAGAPVRMRHATPIPAVLSSPDVVAWYDAADYGSVRPDQRGPARIGSRVVVLRDKSSRHADASQSETAVMPVLGLLNGKPALRLDGQSRLAADERGLPHGGDASTVIAVVAQDDPAPVKSCFRTVVAWGLGRNNQARILEKGCTTELVFAETFGTWSSQKPTASLATGRATVMVAQYDKAGTSLWLDHHLSYSWQARDGQAMNTPAGDGLFLGGAAWNAALGWTGRIGEVIIVARALTAQERQAVELYLGAKWQVLMAPS